MFGGCSWDPPIQAQGSNGALYGIDAYPWRVFKIDSAGNSSTLRAFDADAVFHLALARSGALYGSTDRSVFRIDPAGAFTTLHSLGGYYDRFSPGLGLGSDGEVYGTFQSADSETPGTLFEIDAAGTLTSLHSFRREDGADPSPALVRGSDCALYGTAARGGPLDGGVVFRLYEAGHLCQTLGFDPLRDHTVGDPPFTVIATSSSGLRVSFTATGSCTITGVHVTLTGVGLCTLTASQAGDHRYEPASEVSQEFDVLFDFTGFLRPVLNPPVVNGVKAGRTVPIRFSLGGDQGRDVLAEGSPSVRPVPCDATAPVNDIPGVGTRRSGSLRYAPKRDRYTYLWKTHKSWAGSCRELALELVDGSVHRASFRFGDRPLP